MSEDKRYAVLIDAENVSGKYIKIILEELSNYGVATYKRAYGDWTRSELFSWKNDLLDHSITPIQQYSYTHGKNASDSTMIIDAMDILYSGNVDGFCLATSDSDFTRLASRLRESGMDVIGMGETKTPKAFISACNMFKYLDLIALDLAADEKEEDEREACAEREEKAERGEKLSGSRGRRGSSSSGATERAAAVASGGTMTVKAIRRAIQTIVEENSDEEEWFQIGDLGNLLLKRYPDFDVRNYGFKKFTSFIKSLGTFEVKEERARGKNNKIIYIREKQ